MNIKCFLCIVCGGLFFSACSSSGGRAVGTTLGAAAGGMLGEELGANQLETAGLAAAGALIGTLAVQGGEKRQLELARAEGYIQGQIDQVKRHKQMLDASHRDRAAYDYQVESEKSSEKPDLGKEVIYELPGPRVSPDGRKLVPHTIKVKVVE